MLAYPFKRSLASLTLLALAAACSRAAVSVTEVTVAGTGAPYDVGYYLNTNATSGSLAILNAGGSTVRTIALTGAALSKGAHIVQWDGKDGAGQSVPGGQYRASVSASGDAVTTAGGQILWGPVDSDSNAAEPSEYGLCINRNPGSPYFGRIYVADYSNDRIIAFHSDGTQILYISYKDFNDPTDPLLPLGAGTRGPFIGPDDRLYVGVQADSTVGNGVVAGYLSMTQTGTDVQRVFDSQDQQRALVVTGTGANRRFYYSRTGTRASIVNQASGGSIYLRTEDGLDTAVIDATSDAAQNPPTTYFTGNPDGIVVLDSNNDPAHHSTRTTIYVRFMKTGTNGTDTVVKYDNADPNPTVGPYIVDRNFNVTLPNRASNANGRGLTLGPDGNLWTPVYGPDVATRGYVKLNATTGAQMDKVTVPTGQGSPLWSVADSAGNIVGYQQAEADLTSTSASKYNRAKYLTMYAPQGAANTDTAASAAFTVSGTVLPPINITVAPAVNANATTATITWTTDVSSTSEVSYGTSATTLSSSASSTGLTKNHSVTLTGLTKMTPYFYTVRSSADGYASIQSAVLTFTTKDTLSLTNVGATAAQTTATVTWTTDKPTNSVVLYGTSPDNLGLSAAGNDNTTSHSVPLTGLSAGTTYYFVAQSGSATVETTSSAEMSFATVNASGYKVRTLSTPGDFKYGLMDEITLSNSFTLTHSAAPSGVDDAGVPDLPERRHNEAVVAYGGYLYSIGGRGPQNSNVVNVAAIQANGTVGPWQETSPLTDERVYLPHAGFGYNGYIYVVAGGVATGNTPIPQLTTLFAKQNPLDGTLGPWAVAGSFPDPAGDGTGGREWGHAAVYNGKAYYAGGIDTTSTVRMETLIGDIKTDGTISWTQATELLPVGVETGAMAAHNGRLFLFGGSDGTLTLMDGLNTTLNASGQPGPWSAQGLSFVSPRLGFAGAMTHGSLLQVGGENGTPVSTVSYTPVDASNNLGTTVDATFTYGIGGVTPLRDMDGAVWQDRFYVVGGRPTTGSPDIDSNGTPQAAAITFAPSSTFVPHGHYESQMLDLGKAEPLQSLAVTASTSTGVSLSVRTAGADGAFSAWTPVTGLTTNFGGSASARYVQFAVDLTSSGTSAPVVSSVALTYGSAVVPYTGADVTRALMIASGRAQADSTDMSRLDVVKADGSAGQDQRITVLDALKISRNIAGL